LLFVKTQYIYHYLYLWQASKIIDGVWFPALVTSRVGTHISYLLLFVSGACQQSVLEGAELTVGIARSGPRGRSAPAGREEDGSVRVPRAGLSVAEARRRLAFRGSQTDLTATVGTGSALSQLSHARSSDFQFRLKYR